MFVTFNSLPPLRSHIPGWMGWRFKKASPWAWSLASSSLRES